jgi:hypothetical protein
MGYVKDEFETFQMQPAKMGEFILWPHGDSVVIFAKTVTNELVRVSIDIKPNDENLSAALDETLILPYGIEHLYYIVQIMYNYDTDQFVSVEIEGAFLKRRDAIFVASTCLIDENVRKQDYAIYDERESLEPSQPWPFGDDCVVHAISKTGGNSYLVEVKIPSAVRHQ